MNRKVTRGQLREAYQEQLRQRTTLPIIQGEKIGDWFAVIEQNTLDMFHFDPQSFNDFLRGE